MKPSGRYAACLAAARLFKSRRQRFQRGSGGSNIPHSPILSRSKVRVRPPVGVPAPSEADCPSRSSFTNAIRKAGSVRDLKPVAHKKERIRNKCCKSAPGSLSARRMRTWIAGSCSTILSTADAGRDGVVAAARSILGDISPLPLLRNQANWGQCHSGQDPRQVASPGERRARWIGGLAPTLAHAGTGARPFIVLHKYSALVSKNS